MTNLLLFLDLISNSLISFLQNDFYFSVFVFCLFVGMVVLFRKFLRGF